jgi:hypothetical protein
MAKVQKLIRCPRCLRHLDSERSCECGFLFSPTAETSFKKPDYIYFQKFNTKEDLANWFKNCPHDAQIAALSDAYFTLKYLLLTKPPNTSHIGSLLGMAKDINKLALGIEAYCSSGGYLEYTTGSTNNKDTL